MNDADEKRMRVALKIVSRVVLAIGSREQGPVEADLLAMTTGCLLLSAAAGLQSKMSRKEYLAFAADRVRDAPDVDVTLLEISSNENQH